MNPLTLEWVEKAEGDFSTAQREMRARNAPNYDAVCFHTQQCSEKYLKAILQENGQTIPKIHSLADLVALCIKINPSFTLLEGDLMIMEEYAVQFRYPGQSAVKHEAKQAFKAVVTVRQFIRNFLGL